MLKIFVIAVIVIWLLKIIYFRLHVSGIPINKQYKAIMFFNAVNDNNINLAKALLFYHPVIINSKGAKFRNTPLHCAVEKGYYEMTSILIDNDADIFAKDKFARTPLHCAVYNNDQDLVDLLLNHKAFIDSKDLLGNTPLEIAEKNKFKEIIKCLKQYGK